MHIILTLFFAPFVADKNIDRSVDKDALFIAETSCAVKVKAARAQARDWTVAAAASKTTSRRGWTQHVAD